ncbi:MAG: glycosyltransferase [Gammaproteobacteria bacterium]|nr:glycosyltransferase [Gammaproteobacteria bacterium]
MKGKSKIAVLTVVYPGVEKYIDDYLRSVNDQTLAEFHLVLIDDGLENLYGYLSEKLAISFEILKGTGSPAKNRQIGIRHCFACGIDYLIFADVDDVMSINRVETSLNLLESTAADVVFNDVDIITDNGTFLLKSYFAPRLPESGLTSLSDILHFNYLGMSNTAIQLDSSLVIELPTSLLAVDWYYFSLLLSKGCTVRFNSFAKTLYRQHGSNTVGIKNPSIDTLIQAINVKAEHYRLLKENYREVAKYYEYFDGLLHKIGDIEFVQTYYNCCLKNLEDRPCWWELAKYYEE